MSEFMGLVLMIGGVGLVNVLVTAVWAGLILKAIEESSDVRRNN